MNLPNLKSKKFLFSIVFGLMMVCLVVVIAVGVFLYNNYKRISVHSNVAAKSSPTPTLDPEDAKHFHLNQPYSLLLLGYGGGTHEGGRLTDSMMVAYVEPKSQLITLISIPRDLWVSLEAKEGSPINSKINAAYAIGSDDKKYPDKPTQFQGAAGGGEMAKTAVQQATGLTISNFVAVDFSGFKKSIDVLGGVDVKVETTFDDNQYPVEGKETDTCGKSDVDMQSIATLSAAQKEQQAPQLFPCRYEVLHFDRGLAHMDGETALKYVRSRHSLQDGSDFGRAARQRNLLVAVKNRVLTLNFVPKIIPFISSLSYDLQTDLTLSDMSNFLQFTSELSKYRVTNLALTTGNVLVETRSPDRQDILLPKDGQNIPQWIQDNLKVLREASAAATPSPTASSAGKLGK